jgi:dihydroflavonol-4-reductase
MTKVVVTGASGFIGVHLVDRLLAAGREVTCLVRSPDKLPARLRAQVHIVQGDIHDAAAISTAVAGADQVFHVAGLVKALRPAELFEVNEAGTRRVAEICAGQDKPPTFVLVSSLAATGPSKGERPLQESDTPAPVSHYGRSKLAGETAAREFARRMPITIVRPAVVFGPGDANSFLLFRPVSRWGVHATPCDASGRISMIHVADLCKLLLLAADRGQRLPAESNEQNRGQGIYFGANPQTIPYDDFGRMVGAALGRKKVRVARNRPWSGYALAGVAEAFARIRRRPAILSFDKMREAFAGDWHCSGEKTVRELGFQPSATLADRITETVAWYRANGWLPKSPGLVRPRVRATFFSNARKAH